VQDTSSRFGSTMPPHGRPLPVARRQIPASIIQTSPKVGESEGRTSPIFHDNPDPRNADVVRKLDVIAAEARGAHGAETTPVKSVQGPSADGAVIKLFIDSTWPFGKIHISSARKSVEKKQPLPGLVPLMKTEKGKEKCRTKSIFS
jgi:hypothetical protein